MFALPLFQIIIYIHVPNNNLCYIYNIFSKNVTWRKAQVKLSNIFPMLIPISVFGDLDLTRELILLPPTSFNGILGTACLTNKIPKIKIIN